MTLEASLPLGTVLMKRPAILPASANSQSQSYDSQRGEMWVNWLFQVTEFMKKLSREYKSDLA